MTQDFDRLIPDARAFLTDLAQNNSRDWFLAHKHTYDSELKSPALAVLDTVAAALTRQTGAVTTPKLFRPHRDVRFSKDKTPYHVHLHMLWSTPPVGWFVGISPTYVSIGAGAMGFDKNQLTHWRAAVDGAQGGVIANTIATLASSGARLEPAELKRVPAPYDKDHPCGDLLRRKSLTMWIDLSDNQIAQGNLIDTIETTFARFQPLCTQLRALL